MLVFLFQTEVLEVLTLSHTTNGVCPDGLSKNQDTCCCPETVYGGMGWCCWDRCSNKNDEDNMIRRSTERCLVEVDTPTGKVKPYWKRFDGSEYGPRYKAVIMKGKVSLLRSLKYFSPDKRNST